jgi:polyhydroxybutyrate depolymerase
VTLGWTATLPAAIAVFLTACGGSAAPPTTTSSPGAVQAGSLSVDGRDRTYRAFLPAALDPKHPAPLVIALHGFGQDGAGMADMTGLNNEARARRFVIAYPDGFGKSWNAGGVCCGEANSQRVDDVAFIRTLMDRLNKMYPIDSARVFVTGFSNGAMMAYRLACELSDRVAAIVSVSGTLRIEDCHPARPVSIWEMHGTADSIVPYEGDPSSPSTASVVQRWVTLDGCSTAPIPSNKGITKTSTWNNCRQGTTVRLDTVTTGHHTWFGSYMDPVPDEPGASSVIAAFFGDLRARG